ncbi:Viral polyprotein [Asimina triloba]
METKEAVVAPQEQQSEQSISAASGEAIVVPRHHVEQSKYPKRVLLKAILGRSDKGKGLIGKRVVIGGWVKSSKEQCESSPTAPADRRAAATTTAAEEVTCNEIIQNSLPTRLRSILQVFVRSIGGRQVKPSDVGSPAAQNAAAVGAYLLVNDGSCVPSLQVLVHSSVAPSRKVTPLGTSILVEGMLKRLSIPGKRVIELDVEKVLHIGRIDPENYPLSKPRLPLEFLRSYPHLRPRTTMVASITRVRNALTHGTHTFFQTNGFLHVNMPIITSTDSTGSTDLFQVTTLPKKTEKRQDLNLKTVERVVNVEVVRAAIKEKSNRVQKLQRNESDKEALLAALLDLHKTNQLQFQLEEQNTKMSSEVQKMDISEDFFSQQAYLTASAQLHLECYACALGSVYTFGPTFQAEKSDLPKHLAESWTVDLVIAFSELKDVMNCAEEYLKFLCQQALENCSDDLKLLLKRVAKTTTDHLQSVASSEFERITYTKAIEILMKVRDKTFETQVEWGADLNEEQERYLAEMTYQKPVIIYDHPEDVRPFFARLNDDGRTVAAFDVVIPKVGILIRGCQTEERLDIITRR